MSFKEKARVTHHSRFFRALPYYKGVDYNPQNSHLDHPLSFQTHGQSQGNRGRLEIRCSFSCMTKSPFGCLLAFFFLVSDGRPSEPSPSIHSWVVPEKPEPDRLTDKGSTEDGNHKVVPPLALPFPERFVSQLIKEVTAARELSSVIECGGEILVSVKVFTRHKNPPPDVSHADLFEGSRFLGRLAFG
jgi:hypothetical protein